MYIHDRYIRLTFYQSYLSSTGMLQAAATVLSFCYLIIVALVHLIWITWYARPNRD